MNIELLKRIRYNLKAMYNCNHEFLEQTERVQLLEDIITVEQLLDNCAYEEALIKNSIILRRFGSHWLDEDDVEYQWFDDCDCFYNCNDGKFYMVKSRLDDDRIAVAVAQKTYILPMYADHYDITFLMEHVIVDGIVKSNEVVSWYHGRPDEELTEEYSEDRRLKAEF